jgi:hypothetical protein
MVTDSRPWSWPPLGERAQGEVRESHRASYSVDLVELAGTQMLSRGLLDIRGDWLGKASLGARDGVGDSCSTPRVKRFEISDAQSRKLGGRDTCMPRPAAMYAGALATCIDLAHGDHDALPKPTIEPPGIGTS